MAFVEQKSAINDELYRILFSGMEHRIGIRSMRSIAVTSAIKGEGKTTTVINLARVAVRDFGKRVLLLEGDLKNPQFHRHWPIQDGIGLYHILTQQAQIDLTAKVIVTDLEGLDVMPLGNITNRQDANKSFLIQGIKRVIQRAPSRYDYIFVDSPPVLPLVDMQIIAEAVDGVIMVVQAEGPAQSLVRKAFEKIPHNKILGIVVSKVRTSWSQYSYGYNYQE